MQNRVLLTGSNGLLGQKLVNLLANRSNLELMAVGRGPNRHPLREGYSYRSADLTRAGEVAAIFEEFRPDRLIHTAAMTLVDKCEHEREQCDAINVGAVETLLSLCRRHQTHFTHISTDFVFDGQAGPYAESDPPNPLSYYGHSKLKAEQLIQQSGLEAVILRTMLLYGLTPAMSRSNIVLWVKKSLEAGKPIRVVHDQYRCPTLAEDLAHATLTASMCKATGLYHVSGAEMMSIIELARRVADFWKLDSGLISPIDSASLNQAAKRPPKTGFVILKAQTELDYRPHSLTQGLRLVDRQLREWAELIDL
ncbi:MAG: SDR family oxidoreductase [Bacteroidetes bacterium]|nr:MAG: SDR family oxidoreductase [Bacteroidota bacterium]